MLQVPRPHCVLMQLTKDQRSQYAATGSPSALRVPRPQCHPLNCLQVKKQSIQRGNLLECSKMPGPH